MVHLLTYLKAFKEMFSSAMSIAVIAITSIWCLIDFSSRLLPEVNSNHKNLTFIDIAPLYLPQLSRNEREQLKTNYQKESGTEIDKSNTMSALEQEKQNGLLDSLYINDYKLSLKSVIKADNQLSALILVENIETGKQTIEKFVHQSMVYEYRLEIKNNTQIMLLRKHEHGVQEITLTMYKPRS